MSDTMEFRPLPRVTGVGRAGQSDERGLTVYFDIPVSSDALRSFHEFARFWGRWAGVEGLRATLANIAVQAIPGDAEYGLDQPDDWDGGDFQEGFCIVVRRARAALNFYEQRADAHSPPQTDQMRRHWRAL